ncbi:MAG: hypothetical protein WC755_02045 [Candidatus Woesearchaeota archaeon]
MSPTGVNCYSALREPNGKKSILNITKGAKIISQTIAKEDSIILEHEIRGLAPRKTIPQVLSHSIYLSDLRMINIYDFFTEYLSTSRIDFMYFTKDSPSFSLLDDMNISSRPSPIAQWIYPDEKLDDQLDYLGKTIIIERAESMLDLDLN